MSILYILTFIEILIAFTFIVIVTRLIDNKILNNRKRRYKMHLEWPVYHRLDDKGLLQYSVNNELWTHLIKYVNIDNKPVLMYMKYKNEEDSDYINICKVLSNVNACHTWNKNEFRKYKNSLEKYLSDNKDNK